MVVFLLKIADLTSGAEAQLVAGIGLVTRPLRLGSSSASSLPPQIVAAWCAHILRSYYRHRGCAEPAIAAMRKSFGALNPLEVTRVCAARNSVPLAYIALAQRDEDPGKM